MSRAVKPSSPKTQGYIIPGALAGLAAWLLGLTACPVHAGILFQEEIRRYVERDGNEVTSHEFVISHGHDGPSIQLLSTTGDRHTRQVFLVNPDGSTRAWRFSDQSADTDISTEISQGFIIITGRHKGRSIQKRFSTGRWVWNQLFQIGLENFAAGKESKQEFCAIGTAGPGDMKLGKFTARKRGGERIFIHNTFKETIHIRISLAGVLSIMWHGDYWYQQSDGRFVRYQGRSGPGTPITTLTLDDESRKNHARIRGAIQ